jgi:predicted phosphodiesterase
VTRLCSRCNKPIALESEAYKTCDACREEGKKYHSNNRERERDYKTEWQREDRREKRQARYLEGIGERYTHEELKALSKGKSVDPFSVGAPKVTLSHAGEEIRFGYFTDSHMSSIYYHEEFLDDFIHTCKKRKAQFVVFGGDLTHGMDVRKYNLIYELRDIGYEAQKAYAETQLSKIPFHTYLISGNHDRWYEIVGANIVQDVCEAVPNMEYIGRDEGDIEIGGVIIRVFHGEDGSSYATCFDDKTEIMTSDGWKLFQDLEKTDRVATMRKSDHVFEWQNPTHITDEYYDGGMVHFKARTIDCLVTPSHGMWTRASECATYKRLESLKYPTKSHIRLNTNWHRKDAIDIVNEYGRQKWQFTQVSNGWDGKTPKTVAIIPRESKNPGVKSYHFGDVPIDDIAELIAWYVTEGHARKYYVSLSQYKNVNPENYSAMIDLADRLGCSYGSSKKGITIHSGELADFLKAECGHKSANKYLPKWLKDCDTSVLQIVFETMISGDGWRSPNGYGYRSISKRLLEDFSEIAIKLGYKITFTRGGDTVTITSVQTTPTVNTAPSIVHYTGRVYCCEVPNGLILVRRNGKTLWTHNSYRIQKLIESFTGGDKPQVLLMGHAHKQGYFFERHIHAVSGGALSTQSRWMRSKRMPNHSGYHFITMRVDDEGVEEFTVTFRPFYV